MGIFSGIEKFKLTEDKRKNTARWLIGRITNKRLKKYSIDNSWSNVFIEIFDKIFVPASRKTPLPGFWRSSLASILIVGLLCLLYILHSPDFFYGPLFYHEGNATISIWWKFIFAVFFIFSTMLLAIILNVPADYISLLETRAILSILRKTNRYSIQVLLLVVDTILTFIIFMLTFLSYILIGYVLLKIFVNPDQMNFSITILDHTLRPDYLIEDFLKVWLKMTPTIILFTKTNRIEGFLGIFFYSTFFTSVWIWCFIVAGIIVKTCANTTILKLCYNPWKIRQYPLSIMGATLAIFFLIPFMLYFLFYPS
jgi:hypothetical protein